MEERTIILKESEYTNRKDVLKRIGQDLGFSCYTGNSLDGLNDCLSEVFYPITIVFIHNNKQELSDWMLEVYETLKDISKRKETIKLIRIKEISLVEYLLYSNNLRSGLSDYYINEDKSDSLIIGAFNDNDNLEAYIHATNGKDICAIRNVVYLDENIIKVLIDELISVCTASKIAWTIDSTDKYFSIIKELKWEETSKRNLYIIHHPHDDKIAKLIKPFLDILNKKTIEMNEKGISVISIKDFGKNIENQIISVTEKEKHAYVKMLFDNNIIKLNYDLSYVLLKDSKIISYVLNGNINESNLENVYIYTPIDFRGNGYAKYLTRYMMRVVYESNYDSIRFYVEDKNKASYNLVNKCLNKFVQRRIQKVYTYTKKWRTQS